MAVSFHSLSLKLYHRQNKGRLCGFTACKTKQRMHLLQTFSFTSQSFTLFLSKGQSIQSKKKIIYSQEQEHEEYAKFLPSKDIVNGEMAKSTLWSTWTKESSLFRVWANSFFIQPRARRKLKQNIYFNIKRGVNILLMYIVNRLSIDKRNYHNNKFFFISDKGTFLFSSYR